MADIHQQITIEAAPERVFEALTARDGLAGWWTDDATAADKIGEIAEFGFFNHGMVFRMRVDELAPSSRTSWTCLDGPEEWIGTQVSFDLVRRSEGTTMVRFTHSGWRAEEGMYPSATSTWAQIMPHLKRYAEGKGQDPYFVRDSQ
jgi:uncharacterized protein YndB with AHSA1/START domain